MKVESQKKHLTKCGQTRITVLKQMEMSKWKRRYRQSQSECYVGLVDLSPIFVLNLKAVLHKHICNIGVSFKKFAVTCKTSHSEIMEKGIHLLSCFKAFQNFVQKFFARFRTIFSKIQIADYIIGNLSRNLAVSIKAKCSIAVLYKVQELIILINSLKEKLLK